MNTLYLRIKELALEKKVSLAQIERDLNLGNGTISNWKTKKASSDKVVKLANYFHTSTDYLLGLTKNRFSLSDDEEKDVGQLVDDLLNGVATDASVNFYGEPMTKEQKLSMRAALKTAVEIAKIESKKDDLQDHKL